MIPEFRDGINLPDGGHECSLAQIEERFAVNEHRRGQFDFLIRLLRLARQCGFLHVMIAGSFPTSKEMPRDLDLTWFCKPGTNKTSVQSECIEIMEDRGGGASFQFLPYDQGSSPDQYGEKRAEWASPMFFGCDWKTLTPRGVLILDLADDDPRLS